MMLVTCPASATKHRDAVVRGDLLAQQPDGDLAQHSGVCGVHTMMRGGGRVCGLPGERRLVPAHGLGAGACRVVRDAVLDGMDHQRQADAVERSPFQHEGLAAAVLLGGRSDGLQRDAQLVHVGLQGKGRGDGRARYQVVPARVSDVGERVIFDAQGHGEFAAAGARGEGGGEATGPAFNLEPSVGQQSRCRFGRAELLEGDLLGRVDVPCQGQDLRLPVLDAVGEGGAEGRHGGGCVCQFHEYRPALVGQ